MDSIRIRNLRSLKDTEDISIKKINILVGTNSSGKSTFLRVFPLLKQSFNKKINGPILWCGDDDDYVDFGSFKEALCYNAEEKSINFTFKTKLNYANDMFRYNSRFNKDNLQKTSIEFWINNSENTGNDYISKMQYKIDLQNVLVYFRIDGSIERLELNGEKININSEDAPYFPYFYDRSIFDISLYQITKTAIDNLMNIFTVSNDEEKDDRFLEEATRYIVNEKILHQKCASECNEKVLVKIKEIYKTDKKEELEKWAFLYKLSNYFGQISEYLRGYFRNVYYIAPVRATAERYYRLRNAAVNEVDCRGKNLPVFLNSLSNENFRKFQSWTKEYLGFEVETTTSEGHVSLKIRKKGQEKAVNLSDTGFGYSQILPIVTQIWYIAKQSEDVRGNSIYFYNYDVPTTIVIEQPELHLHPALQAKLIDIIVKVAKQGNIKFIIETHSETIVNRIGTSIEKREISNEDIGVLLFEKGFEEDDTIVRKGGFDEEGYLNNWPIGFFEPEGE